MIATKIFTSGCGFVGADVTSNEFPSFLHVRSRTRHFEVINIYGEEQHQFRMEEAALPFLDRDEAFGCEMFLAMTFPIASRIRMSIKR
jgi:hypothetical protein